MDYKTTDLNLAAFLKAKYKFKIRQLEPDPRDNDRVFFVFAIDDNIEIEQYVSDYYNEEDLCSINAFMREIVDLRSWLKSYKTNRDNAKENIKENVR